MRLIILLALLIPSLAWTAEKKKTSPAPATPTTTQPAEAPILRPGSEEAPEAAPEQATPVPARDPDESIRFGLGLFYHGGDKLTFKDVDTTTAGKQDIDFSVDKAGGVVASLQIMPQESWGFLGTLNFESARKIKSTTSTGTLTFDGTGDKITILTVDGSLVYRWHQFYLPFGLNVSGMAYKADQSGANVKTRGGFGVQFGGGWMFTSNLAADLMIKSIGAGFDQDLGGPKTEYKIGTLTGWYLDLRWVF